LDKYFATEGIGPKCHTPHWRWRQRRH